MELHDELTALTAPKLTKIEQIRAAMTDPERAAFDIACRSETGSRDITNVLRKHGHDIGRTTLDEYRAGLREHSR